MTKNLHTNNAASTLASALTQGGTYATLADASMFAPVNGDTVQMLTLFSASQIEVVRMRGKSGNIITLDRGREGTEMFAWPAGTKVEARVTAGMLDKFAQNSSSQPLSGLAIGDPYSDATYDAVALGNYARAFGPFSFASGPGSITKGQNALALGYFAQADSDYSLALAGARAYRQHQFAMAAHHCIPRDDFKAGSGSYGNAGSESAWASQYVDLGTPAAWAANTLYVDGDVISPVTPDGTQYVMWHGGFNSALDVNSLYSGSTAPAGMYPYVDDNAVGYWLQSNLSTGITETIPPGMVFYPSEAGFICFNYEGVTAAPYVSIGTAANPTLLVNNQQLSQITGPTTKHKFTDLPGNGITDLTIKLVTPATGSGAKFHGRFYIKGLFIQTQG